MKERRCLRQLKAFLLEPETGRRAGKTERKEGLTLDGKEERLIEVSDGGIQPGVTGLHERLDLGLSDLGVPALKSGKTRTHHDGGVFSVVTVLGEKVSHLHVHELKHLVVVNLAKEERGKRGGGGRKNQFKAKRTERSRETGRT